MSCRGECPGGTGPPPSRGKLSSVARFTLHLDPIEPCRTDALARVKEVVRVARQKGLRSVLVKEPQGPAGRSITSGACCRLDQPRHPSGSYGQAPQWANIASRSVTPTKPSSSKSIGCPVVGPHTASRARRSVTSTVPFRL